MRGPNEDMAVGIEQALLGVAVCMEVLGELTWDRPDLQLKMHRYLQMSAAVLDPPDMDELIARLAANGE